MSRIRFDKLVAFAERELALDGARLSDEYYYASLGHCVLDSVFSLGIRYETVRVVVRRYSEHYGIPTFRAWGSPHPPAAEQEPITTLIQRIREAGPAGFAEHVVRNRCRISTRGGVLKAEAALRFAEMLAERGVLTFCDVATGMSDGELDQLVRRIPGQKSIISLSYLWMLAGSGELVKADRMVRRFFGRALGREVSQDEAEALTLETAAALRLERPTLTPRHLDYLIWERERSR